MSGAVLNVAITVDGKHPIRCASRFTKEGTSLRLVTVRDLQETASDSGTKGFEIIEFHSLQEIRAAFKDTQAWYSLLLAVLIVLGVVDFARPDTPRYLRIERPVLGVRRRRGVLKRSLRR